MVHLLAMCVAAIAHNVSTRYPLIVAANRDERHARPSAPADWWDDEPSVLAGRDLVAGGTWLGVTDAGRLAVVTNIFEPGTAAGERSRGELVTGFLRGSMQPSDYAAAVEREGDYFGPFNLALGFGDELAFVSNRNSSRTLEAGIHVFSNNAPGLQWTKTDMLAEAIRRGTEHEDPHEFLIESLCGPRARGRAERVAESLFVVGEDFGTRCTTVLTLEQSGRARFIEQRFAAGGVTTGRSEFEFDCAK